MKQIELAKLNQQRAMEYLGATITAVEIAEDILFKATWQENWIAVQRKRIFNILIIIWELDIGTFKYRLETME